METGKVEEVIQKGVGRAGGGTQSVGLVREALFTRTARAFPFRDGTPPAPRWEAQGG